MPEIKKEKSKMSYEDEMAWKERQEQLKKEKELEKISKEERKRIEKEERERIEEDEDYDDLLDFDYRHCVEKSPKVKIIEDRCRVLLKKIGSNGLYDSGVRFEQLCVHFNSFSHFNNNLRDWQKFQNSIIKYICDDIMWSDFMEVARVDFDEETLNYVKRKIDSFFLGKAKLKKLISKEQNSKANVVENKIIQNKSSQRD